MWLPKGCTRCGGDLYATESEDGLVHSCLQCGREVLVQPRHPLMTDAEILALFHEADDVPDLAA
ncbi:MAG TPA: hypothetical protein VK009_23525 [Chloroflexota bacterium]|nr:hypothetical protein [Chloroflexota bacterium]